MSNAALATPAVEKVSAVFYGLGEGYKYEGARRLLLQISKFPIIFSFDLLFARVLS